MGLMAAADPQFAERLLESLRCLPAERASQPAAAGETNSVRREELCA
jgi:hypothetical protein